MMSTTPSIPPSCASASAKRRRVLALGRVARPRDAADLGGDVGREPFVLVDAEQPRTHRRQRVRRLAADALPGADHHEPATVEPELSGVVGYLGVVGAGHPVLVSLAGPVMASRLRRSDAVPGR